MRRSRLTVVTGPAADDNVTEDGYADVGPVAALLAAPTGQSDGIDDGLTVRVIGPETGRPHRSPDPFHGPGTAVMLHALPAAWQDPQTNLGVDVGPLTSMPHLLLRNDLVTLDALGLNPGHRLTVAGELRQPPEPVERGDLGVIARDSVLRAGGHVLVEAGDGITVMAALAALNLPPWADWIDQLDLWVAVNLATLPLTSGPATDPRDVAAAVAAVVHPLLGGAPRWAPGAATYPTTRVSAQVALYGLTEFFPDLAGLGGHYLDDTAFGKVGVTDTDRLEQLDRKLIGLCGANVGLIHTGTGVQSRVHPSGWLDLTPWRL